MSIISYSVNNFSLLCYYSKRSTTAYTQFSVLGNKAYIPRYILLSHHMCLAGRGGWGIQSCTNTGTAQLQIPGIGLLNLGACLGAEKSIVTYSLQLFYSQSTVYSLNSLNNLNSLNSFNSFSLYSIQSTAVYSIQSTAVYSIQSTAYNLQHTIYSIQSTAYSLQQPTTVYSIHTV